MGTEGPDPGVSQGRSPGSASCWLWDLQPVISVPLSLICFLCKTSTLAILTVRICRQEPEMRCVSASLGAGIKCSVLGGYSHLLTQRTGSEEGSQSQAGSQGKRILGEPPDHTQARKRRWIPQRRPEDISGHPGSRPGAGQSGQDPVASPPLPCGGGRMPPTRFRASL